MFEGNAALDLYDDRLIVPSAMDGDMVRTDSGLLVPRNAISNTGGSGNLIKVDFRNKRREYPSRMSGMMSKREEEEKTFNPAKRWWRKVGKVRKNYTEFGNPLRLYKPLAAGLVASVVEYYKKGIPESEKRKGLQEITGGFADIIAPSLRQYQHNSIYEIMPALRRHLSAAEGTSNIKYLYVYSDDGPKEIPIYLSEGQVPEEDTLRERIKYVQEHGVSPHQDDTLPHKGNMKNLFDRQDGPPVINAATLFDYGEYFRDQPDKLERWAVMGDSWLAQQYGKRNTEMESKLPADMKNNVRIYERPVDKKGFWYKIGEYLGDESPRSGRMWLEWAVKKPLIYMVADFMLESLETGLERILPTEVVRYVVAEKAKAVDSAWRGFSNPRIPYLFYGSCNKQL